MSRLSRGLYEQLLTDLLTGRLADALGDPKTEYLRAAEAADRIAWHLASFWLGRQPESKARAQSAYVACVFHESRVPYGPVAHPPTGRLCSLGQDDKLAVLLRLRVRLFERRRCECRPQCVSLNPRSHR